MSVSDVFPFGCDGNGLIFSCNNSCNGIHWLSPQNFGYCYHIWRRGRGGNGNLLSFSLCSQSRQVIWLKKPVWISCCLWPLWKFPCKAFGLLCTPCCVCCSTCYFLDLFQPFSSLVSWPLSLRRKTPEVFQPPFFVSFCFTVSLNSVLMLTALL